MGVIYHIKSVWVDIRSGAAVCQAIYDFVSLYTNKVSYTSGDTKLKFNDRFYFSIPNGIENRVHMYLIREDETSVDLGNIFGYWVYNNSPMQMTLKIVGPVFILKIVRENYSGDCGSIYWIDNGDNDFFTAIQYGTTMSIDVGSYYDARTIEPTVYTIKKLIPFTIEPQQIAYTSYSYISNSDNILIRLNDVCSCSTIARDSLITISGKNYYAIGTNLLICVS